MYKSGYVMVDCKKANLLAQSAQTVTGIYVNAKDAIDSGKPILACNCEYGVGVPLTPITVFAIIEAGVLIFTASILQIRVTDEDSVTVVSLLN
ncbi:MAG: hypothetical protein LIR46_03380 [Bacteroidota bacterium]|nr:hypothetical protein [Bacteroidota bacterium]